MFKLSKQRSSSLGSLYSNPNLSKENISPNNNSLKIQAKNKLFQVKSAKAQILKVFNSDLQEYEHFYESFLNKKEYLSTKEQELLSDLIETNRLYQQEKSKKACPLDELLCDFDSRAGYFSEIYAEFEEILLFYDCNFAENNDVKAWKQQFILLHAKKIQTFHEFFDLKLKENQLKETKLMLKEEIQGKIIQNIEYAFSLEELETRTNEYQRALEDRNRENNRLVSEDQENNIAINNKSYENHINNNNNSFCNKKCSENLDILALNPDINQEKNRIVYITDEDLNQENILCNQYEENPTQISSFSIKSDNPSQENRLKTIKQQLNDLTISIAQQKNARNELFLILKAWKDKLKNLSSELENGKKKRHCLQKFIAEAEIQNNMQDFEENIKSCLNEKGLFWLNETSHRYFDYKYLLLGKFPLDYDGINHKQQDILDEIKRFPSNTINGEIAEVLKQGTLKNKHFRDNLSVFFEFKEDLYSQVFVLLKILQEKSLEYDEALKKKYELEIEFHQKETTLYFSSKQASRKQAEITQLSSNIIKIKDFLAFSSFSSTEDLNLCIQATNEEMQRISRKRIENQKVLDQLLKEFPEEIDYLLANKVSELYGVLVLEKGLMEALKDKYESNGNNHLLFKRFYVGLIRNFNLLENKESLGDQSNLTIQSNLQLFEEKIEMLSSDLEKMKTENLREMCQMNGEMVRKQLRVEESRQKIKALDKYIRDIKTDNNIKTLTTKQTEESFDRSELNKSNITYNPKILTENKKASLKPSHKHAKSITYSQNIKSKNIIGPQIKNHKNPDTIRHKSFSFVNSGGETAKYGNVSIDLLGKTNGNIAITVRKKSSFISNYSIHKPYFIKAKNENNPNEINGKTTKKSLDISNEQELSVSSKSFLERANSVLDFPLQLVSKSTKNLEKQTVQPLKNIANGINIVSASSDIKEKILKFGLEVYKLQNINYNNSIMKFNNENLLKLRLLKIDLHGKKIELFKKYVLAGKDKIAIENSLFFNDIKHYEIETKFKKNTGKKKISNEELKEIEFRIEVSSLGVLRIKMKDYREGKEFRGLLREVGIEERTKSVCMVKKMR